MNLRWIEEKEIFKFCQLDNELTCQIYYVLFLFPTRT